MSALVNVALPVFAIILAGFITGRTAILGAASSEALNKFVYWIALPPLLFLGTARAPLAEFFNLPFLGAFLGGCAIAWIMGSLIGALLHRPRADAVVLQGMNASFPNTGYMGIPLFFAAFGEPGLAPAILATVAVAVVNIAVAIVSLEACSLSRDSLKRLPLKAGRAVATNPLVLSSALGVAWSYFALPIPTPLATLLDLLGTTAGPCALFSIGLFMAFRPLGANLLEAGWISAVKLIWQPLATWLLIATVFPLPPFWAASALILSALPTGALVFVVAQQYGTYADRTSSAILVSTIASVVSVSLILAAAEPWIAAG